MKSITVRLRPEEFALLDALAKSERSTQSAVLRGLLLASKTPVGPTLLELENRLKALESLPAQSVQTASEFDATKLEAEIEKVRETLAALIRRVLWLSLPPDKKELLRGVGEMIDVKF